MITLGNGQSAIQRGGFSGYQACRWEEFYNAFPSHGSQTTCDILFGIHFMEHTWVNSGFHRTQKALRKTN